MKNEREKKTLANFDGASGSHRKVKRNWEVDHARICSDSREISILTLVSKRNWAVDLHEFAIEKIQNQF